MSEYNLKEKMGDWGPYGNNEGEWLIFSVGNPYEGHGLALPKAIDDFHAKKAAFDLELKTGQKYVAHIPYTTDRCGPVAKDWAPYYIPWEAFYQKTVNFMKYYVDIFRNRGESASKVMLITGHGGNGIILERHYQREICQKLELSKFIAITALISRKDVNRVLEELKKLSESIINKKIFPYGLKDPENLKDFYIKVLMSAGHASHVEHSLAAAMGLCDLEKVGIMNAMLEKNFEGALKKWPAIGGLGGYLLAGGRYTEALGTQDNDKYGLWNCLAGLRDLNGGKLIVEPELGHIIHKISLETKSELISRNMDNP